ncbi:MAG: hypothetical protein IPO21_17215 [Bacteroidales bacterium]|nr:hypothetical protein [Bacteroidales bacterium]
MNKILVITGLLATLFIFTVCNDIECCEDITYIFYNHYEKDSVKYDIKFIDSGKYRSGMIPYPAQRVLKYDEQTPTYYFGENLLSLDVLRTEVYFLIKESNSTDSIWTDTLYYDFKGRSLYQGDHLDIFITASTSFPVVVDSTKIN